MDDLIVSCEQGKLRGRSGNDIRGNPYIAFLGIPYARPPIGPLRFKAPQPATNWKGVRDATQEGHICSQRHATYGKQETFETNVRGSEDCLCLNIFTHDIIGTNWLKPVMFFIHGGAFTGGSGTTEMCGPEILMTEDIVFITINYRLGALGFFSMENVPGNAGLKDMVQALKWTKRNVGRFGGDSDNVTIFGVSAGAAAVHYLILSPLAKGLFHKAIMQSGCALNAWARGENNGRQFAKQLGCTETDADKILEYLQKVPVEKIIQAQIELADDLDVVDMRPFGPCIEPSGKGAFITEDPLDLIACSQYNQVPMIIGYTSLEGMLIELLKMMKDINTTVFVPYLLNLEKNSAAFQETNKKIISFYFGGPTPDETNKDALYLVYSDNLFVREINRTIKAHLETAANPIYVYRMSVESNLNWIKRDLGFKIPGVCHGDDMGYFLTMPTTPKIVPGSLEDFASRRLVKMWTNFAAFGNPTPDQEAHLNVEWKSALKGEMHFLDFGNDLVVGVDPDGDRVKFWEGIFKNKH